MNKLIVIEGTDGSGKQTQSEKLKQYFEDNNLKYKSLSFPNYESPSSTLVKMYLNGEFGTDATKINPYISSAFFAVDRYATYIKEFKEDYENGKYIIADRYTTANMIHQGCKIKDDDERKKYLDWLMDFEYIKFELPRPDLTIFLNMPPEYSKKLIEDRENKITHQQKKDIHESNKKYLEHCYDVSLEIAKTYNWKIVNCIKDNMIKSIEEIHSEILEFVKKI